MGMIDRVLDTISHRVFLGVQPQGNANHCIKVADRGERPAVCRDASQDQNLNDLVADCFLAKGGKPQLSIGHLDLHGRCVTNTNPVYTGCRRVSTGATTEPEEKD